MLCPHSKSALSYQFQGLAFLVMSSNACRNTLIQDLDEITPLFDIQVEETCAMVAGAKCTIAATVLWFCAAIPAFKIDIPRRGAAVSEKKEKEAEADEQTLDPDGHEVVKDEAVEIATGAGEIAIGTEKEAETA